MKFSVNQIVKGEVAGFFVIIGFRLINNVQCAQLKRYCRESGETLRGELSLPLTSLREA
jgi:hypothetical protein